MTRLNKPRASKVYTRLVRAAERKEAREQRRNLIIIKFNNGARRRSESPGLPFVRVFDDRNLIGNRREIYSSIVCSSSSSSSFRTNFSNESECCVIKQRTRSRGILRVSSHLCNTCEERLFSGYSLELLVSPIVEDVS